MFNRIISIFLVTLFVWGQTLPAQAAMLSTETVVQQELLEFDREQLVQMLDRAEVQQQLVALGVDIDAAKLRVAQMSDSEIQQLNSQLADMPAGGDILGLAALIFIVFIITDGDDNSSGSVSASDVGDALNQAMRDEALESIVSILIGVGVGSYHGIGDYLDTFKNDAGLSQYVEIKDAYDKSLAKLADFISKSVSSQSSALGSGGASQPLTF